MRCTNTAMNASVPVLVGTFVFVSLGFILRSGSGESYGTYA